MNITSKQVLDLAAKYIGYKEKASNKDLYSFEGNAGKGNYTMFQHELDAARFWNNSKQGYEWCTSFVAWCFWRLCGNVEAKRILCLTGDYGAGCTAWASYYKAQARLFTKPKVGDQYFQRGSDGQPCHTGIVETVNGNTFTTIEGNAGNMVKRVNHKLDSTVYGFGRPYYSEQKEEDDMVRYKTLDEIPEGYRAGIKKIIDVGSLKGKGGTLGLDLTEDMIRVLLVSTDYIDKAVNKVPQEIADTAEIVGSLVFKKMGVAKNNT